MWASRIKALATVIIVACAANAQGLFTATERKAVGEIIASHIEKTVNTLASSDGQTAYKLATQKNFHILIDERDVAPKEGAVKLLTLKSKPYKFYLGKTDKSISCRWKFDKSKEVRIMAEMSREAVEGTDKEEADRLVFELLKQLPKNDSVMPMPKLNQLTRTAATNMLVLKADTFMLKTINGDTYYDRKGFEIRPTFSSEYPVETLHNIMLNAAASDYTMLISQNVYNQLTEPTKVSLKDFVAYWQQKKGYNMYCGVSRADEKSDYDVMLVVENRDLQYIHLLTFKFAESMFGDTKAEINATLTPNIPQHNVKSLL